MDGSGQLVRFTIRPGNIHDSTELIPILGTLPVGEVVADKAYDTNAIRRTPAERGITATIPSRAHPYREPIPYDTTSYRTRHLVENLFAALKQFRGLTPATASSRAATARWSTWRGGTWRRREPECAGVFDCYRPHLGCNRCRYDTCSICALVRRGHLSRTSVNI